MKCAQFGQIIYEQCRQWEGGVSPITSDTPLISSRKSRDMFISTIMVSLVDGSPAWRPGGGLRHRSGQEWQDDR